MSGAGAPPTPALSVDGLGVELGGRTVLRDVAFALRPGEFCGLIGTNGSGKTTLLRAILGLLPAGRGRVYVNGRPAGSHRAQVGYVPQKIAFDPDLPVRARDLVALGADGHRLGLPLPSATLRSRVDATMAAVGALPYADERIGRLSGGEQQRVVIAHALIRRPSLLLLDEPLANLDVAGAAEVVGVVTRLARDEGIAVLLSAHDMNPLLAAMDRIVYLAGGRAASGGVDEVVRGDVLTALYGRHVDVIRVHDRILVAVAPAEIVVHPDRHAALVPGRKP